ncbi:hypothetical protein [Lacticaseibacillus porcinae]|uniref:hypothetical protein n=1 Tax=Lacticaseibacillus porcinae TaxID=1123687 RepID=UPI000F7902DB|nr:hypothetical protein [Lacticaseibacillus porcinae]
MRSLTEQTNDLLAHAGFTENDLVLYTTIRKGFGQWFQGDAMRSLFGNQTVLLVFTETTLTMITPRSKREPDVMQISLNQTSAWQLTAQLNYFVLELKYQGQTYRFGIDNGQYISLDDGRTQRNLKKLLANGFCNHLPRNPQA